MTTHRFRSLLLVVMAVGLAVRIASIATAEECEIIDYEIGQISEDRCADITDAVNYRNVAKANAEGHWFQQFVLYGDNYEDTALHPPAYSVYLSLWWRLGVTGDDGLRYVSALLSLLTIGGVGLLGRHLGGARVGLIAATLVALNPMVWINDVVLLSEALFAPVAVGAMLAGYRFVRSRRLIDAALVGAIIGLAGLTRTESIVATALVGVPLAFGIWRDDTGAVRSVAAVDRWRTFGAIGGATLLVLSPWVALNLARFNQSAPLTTTAGYGTRLGNCDDTYYDDELFAAQSPRCLQELNDPARRQELGIRDVTGTADESDVNANLLDLSQRYVKDNLGRAPVVAVARAGRMWSLYRPFQTIRVFEPVERRGEGRSQVGTLFGWAVLVGGVIGAKRLFDRRVPLSPLLAWVATATLVAMVDLGLQRFRVAGEIALCVLAAVAVDAWWTRRELMSGIGEGEPSMSSGSSADTSDDAATGAMAAGR